MFLLPDRATPLGLVTGGPPATQRVLGAAAAGGAKQEIQVVAFLESRGWSVAFCLEATPELWAVSADLGLLEQGGDAVALRRQWPFQPSSLLTQEIGRVEALLASSRLDARDAALAAGEAAAGPSSGGSGDCCELGRLGGAHAAVACKQHENGTTRRLALRMLDVGCGSGRDLAWLSTREPRVVVPQPGPGCAVPAAAAEQPGDDGERRRGAGGGTGAPPPTGVEVQIAWECVGLDSWHGALERAAEVLALGAVPAGPGVGGAARVGAPSVPGCVTLHLVQIQAGTGALEPLPLPPVARRSGQREQLLGYLGCYQRREREDAASVQPDGDGGAGEGAPGGASSLGADFAQAGAAAEAVRDGCGSRELAELPDLEAQFDLVVCVRFLERAFMARMAAALQPGGIILFSTFVDGPGLRAFGRPQGREHVLQPDELARNFFGPDQGFQVLRDEVECIPDGREVTMFCARKL